MRKMELLGLSVVTAALIVTTGCSDDEDASSGHSAPSEITQAVEMNVSVAQNSMALVDRTIGYLPNLAPARVNARLSALKARSSETGNSTQSYDCDVSGTYTVSDSKQATGDKGAEPDKNWSIQESDSISYDNCIDNYTGVNFVGDELDQRIRNGGKQNSDYSEYNSETNQTKESYSEHNDITDVKRSTATKATITEINNDNFSSEGTYDGIDAEAKNANLTMRFTYKESSEMYHTNTGGAKVAGIGNRAVGDYTYSVERIYTPAKSTGKSNVNGFYAQYDTNSTGEHVTDGAYFSNYSVIDTKVGDEETTTISGTIGDKCLGGSVTVSVDPIVKDNKVEYVADGLPYSGKVILSGNNKAAIEFSVLNAAAVPKTTKATMTVDEGSTSVFTDWNTLATGECQDD